MAENKAYNAEVASTWMRFSEKTDDDGEIVLVRYPEGYRLRYHGEVVWTQEKMASTGKSDG
jgi:hypothetical protein